MKNGSGDKIGDQSDDYDCGDTETNKSTPESGPLQNWVSNGGSSANYLKHFEEKLNVNCNQLCLIYFCVLKTKSCIPD